MRLRTRRIVSPTLALLLAAAVSGVAPAHAQAQTQTQTQTQAPEPMRAEADAMQLKIDRVAEAAEAERPADARALRTTFTEREINSYLALEGPTFLPAGVAMPRIQLGDDGRVRARAILDLDAVSSSRDGITPASDSLVALTTIMNRIAVSPCGAPARSSAGFTVTANDRWRDRHPAPNFFDAS